MKQTYYFEDGPLRGCSLDTGDLRPGDLVAIHPADPEAVWGKYAPGSSPGALWHAPDRSEPGVLFYEDELVKP